MSAATTARGQRARTDILNAARTTLLDVGPTALSLREVARRAGYAPSALYNHFADRDALVLALAMESLGALSRYLGEVDRGTPLERLEALGEAYVRFGLENPEAYRVIFDCLTNPPGSWAHYTSVADPFTRIIAACRDGLADGSLVDRAGVGPEGLAYGLWALCDGHLHLQHKHLSAVSGPFDSIFSAAVLAMLAGLSSTDPR